MCEDGLSTPVPLATYKFLQWLKADVYVARCRGTYFAMPKWTSGFRPGRTHLDIYKLFSREELKNLDMVQVKDRAEEALLFDAYREQEIFKVKYSNGSDVRGLEHVLYQCPHCLAESRMTSQGTTLTCTACGKSLTMRSTRSFISLAALFVKVSARIFQGL